MTKNRKCGFLRLAALAIAAGSVPMSSAFAEDAALDPAALPLVRKVDPRFQSYNVEMVEVVGGLFWAPVFCSRMAARASKKP